MFRGSRVDQVKESITAQTTVAVPSDGRPLKLCLRLRPCHLGPGVEGNLYKLLYKLYKLLEGSLQAVDSDSTLNGRLPEPITETDNSPRNNRGVCLYDFLQRQLLTLNLVIYMEGR